MAIEDDFSVSVAGDIRHVSGTATYTVLELHRYLQDLADDAVSSGDDLHDITDLTSSDRSTDNIITLLNSYNIDDTAAQFLYDGSITQDSGDTVYSGLVVVGSLNAGDIMIIQDDAVLTDTWSVRPNASGSILLRTLVKTRVNGADIDDKKIRVQSRDFQSTYAEFAATLGLGNVTAALFTSNDLNNQTAQGTVAGWTITNTEGYQELEISGTAPAEPYYSQWDRGAQSTNDLYEFAKNIQRDGSAETIHGMNGQLFRGVTHEIPYDSEASAVTTNDVIAWGGASFAYDGESGGPFTLGEYVTIGTAVGKLVSLDDNGATGFMVVQLESGSATPADNDTITGLSSSATAAVNGSVTSGSSVGGTGRVLAVDDNGTTGTIWIQLLTGEAPGDNDQVWVQNAAAFAVLVNGSVTSRTVSAVFLGVSTGSALLGTYGIGMVPGDTTASDQFTDLGNNLVIPPNQQQFTVTGLVSGEDRVLVGPRAAGVLDLDQFGLQTALTTDNITSVQIDATIPSDTPATGFIRVADNDGVYRRLSYSSYSGDTFTIDTTDGNEDFATVNANAANDVFIAYIDELASGTTATFTSVYSSDRDLFVRVRDGGGTPIKTFESPATFGSAGGSAAAIRTSDA